MPSQAGENPADAVLRGSRGGRHRREAEIARVLARHGLHAMAGLLNVGQRAHRSGGATQLSSGEWATAAELRAALAELGPTFIKLGQLLATRADLLAPEYRRELASLQDAAPPASLELIREIVEQELTDGVAGSFAEFEEVPLAAGSVGQAHAAVLHNGARVVVKVRKPGVEKVIGLDLEILVNLAARASRRWPAAEAFDVIGLAHEFAGELRGQLDYIREACNAARFAANFAGNEEVRVPGVIWELTSSRVITLERLEGVKITDRAALDAAGVDAAELARRAAVTVGEMVFAHGFFHGDPHPGNFFVEPDGRLGIIDFGIMGSLGDDLRAKVRRILLALDRRDPGRLATALLVLRGPGVRVDRAELRSDLARVIDAHLGHGIGEAALGGVLRSLLDVIRRHRLRIPRDLSLLFRTVLLEEGIVQTLDPDFRMVDSLSPLARQDLFAGVTAAGLLDQVRDTGLDLAELASELPGQVRRVLDVIDDGGFDVHLRASELEPLMERAERLANRIALSVLAAALLNAAGQTYAGGRRVQQSRRGSRARRR
jgi:ubiquinone biosynthesis protein